MEENKDNLMDFFGLMMLGFIFKHNISGTDKEDALIKAIKDKDCGSLSELTGISIDTCQKAVDSIRNILAKQAEEQGITIKEFIDNLNNK